MDAKKFFYMESQEGGCNLPQKSYAEVASAFNYKLLSAIAATDGGEKDNIFVSPCRLQALLVLLSNWAGGSVRNQIRQAICCDDIDCRELNRMFADERFLIPNVDRKDLEEYLVPTIDLSTMMLYQKELAVNKRTIADTKDFFDVHYRSVDFSVPSLSAEISREVEKASHGMIANLRIDVNEAVRALLLDVFYFKACWVNYFDEEQTQRSSFYHNDGISEVDMMSVTDVMRYHENDVFQSVCLDYWAYMLTKRYSMWIHLPKKGHGIDEVLSLLADEDVYSKYEDTEVHLNLPRFEIEKRTNLTDVLRQMGMGELFSATDGIPNLIAGVSFADVIQQGKIKVDEYGAESAVTTYCAFATGCCPDEEPEPVEMNVNRNFIFEIVETSSGSRLFSGVVNKL